MLLGLVFSQKWSTVMVYEIHADSFSWQRILGSAYMLVFHKQRLPVVY